MEQLMGVLSGSGNVMEILSNLKKEFVDLNPKDFVLSGSIEEYQRAIDNLYDNDDSEGLRTICGEELSRKIALSRNEIFAHNIRRAREIHGEGIIVAIMGKGHLFDNHYLNVYDMLSDLNPKRMKLKEADSL
jgi:hypothetical protein